MQHKTLILISLIAVVVALLMPAIPQNPAYHNFVDQQQIAGIPHFFNVISKMAFLLVGFVGARYVLVHKQLFARSHDRYLYPLFFISVFLVGCGSAFYHLSPKNSTLVWDRLPMSIAFMSFFSIILAEFVNQKLALKLAIPLILLGVLSVVYWYWSELMGQGDLRLYILVQFLPVILLPLIFILYSSRFNNSYYLWAVLGCYILAKIFELQDEAVYELTAVLSGHTVKHLLSAAGPYMFYRALCQLENK